MGCETWCITFKLWRTKVSGTFIVPTCIVIKLTSSGATLIHTQRGVSASSQRVGGHIGVSQQGSMWRTETINVTSAAERDQLPAPGESPANNDAKLTLASSLCCLQSRRAMLS